MDRKSHPDLDAFEDGDPHPHGDIDLDAYIHQFPHSYSISQRHGNCDGYGHFHRNPDGHADSQPERFAERKPHVDFYRDTDNDHDGHRRADLHARSRHQRR